MLMGENAGLSLIGDAAFAGVAKGARVLKNTYNMTKTGARAGKDMIDGMAVKGGNLGNRVIDKITQRYSYDRKNYRWWLAKCRNNF